MLIPKGLAAALATSMLRASLLTSADATSKAVYLDHAMNATDVLNREWYSQSSGLWQDFWWSSGATLATIGDLALLNDDYKATASEMFGSIVVAAKASNGGTFLNAFFDDEGWWAMGWIKAYDVTHDEKYLDVAREIFEDMTTGREAACGGIWWSKDKTYNAAISNQLFLAVAASLANRCSDKRQQYRAIAEKQVDWLLSSGMMNDNSTFNDGLNVLTCKVTGEVYSYNQGVILGALVELYQLTGYHNYLGKACDIALGAIKQLASQHSGILTEAGYPDAMDNTRAQFKGIFARNLMYLQYVSGREEFTKFLYQNADSIWKVDRGEDGQIGVLWQGPIKSLSAAAQTSGLDCLVAAAGVSPADELATTSSGAVCTVTTTAVLTVTKTAGKAQRATSMARARLL